MGGRRPLTPSEQVLLATWAVKTCQVYETTCGQPLVFSQADREVIMTEGRPPAHVRVWAMAYDGSVGPTRSTLIVCGVGAPDQLIVGRAYLGTIQVGCLVFQVGGADPGISTGNGIEGSGSATRLRIQIYPPIKSIAWPPAQILDDVAFIDATEESRRNNNACGRQFHR